MATKRCWIAGVFLASLSGLLGSSLVGGEDEKNSQTSAKGAQEKRDDSAASSGAKKRIFIVSSYSRHFRWCQLTNEGVCDVLLEKGLLDNKEQVAAFIREDRVESSRAVLQKEWMHAKTFTSEDALAEVTLRIAAAIRAFRPDLLLLGDDDAANYIGNTFLDTEIPIVFWGINGLPTKYQLVYSLERPGRNVTGVYQTGYYVEGSQALSMLVPEAKTFALIGEDTPSGRIYQRAIQKLAREGSLSLTLADSFLTNSFAEWKEWISKKAPHVDAFFFAPYAALKDEEGQTVPVDVTMAWFLRTIPKPTFAGTRDMAERGVLCVVDDSPYRQGEEAMRIGCRILLEGASPATIPCVVPPPGPLLVNAETARLLGLGERVEKCRSKIDEIIAVAASLHLTDSKKTEESEAPGP